MKLVLAVEIGITSSKVGLVNQYGDLQAKFLVDHNLDNLLPNLYNKIIEGLETIGISYENRLSWKK